MSKKQINRLFALSKESRNKNDAISRELDALKYEMNRKLEEQRAEIEDLKHQISQPKKSDDENDNESDIEEISSTSFDLFTSGMLMEAEDSPTTTKSKIPNRKGFSN